MLTVMKIPTMTIALVVLLKQVTMITSRLMMSTTKTTKTSILLSVKIAMIFYVDNRNSNLKIPKALNKAKRTRAPTYSRALRRIKGGFSKGGQEKLR